MIVVKTKLFKERVMVLNVVVYSLGCYALTAIISFGVIGIVVVLNHFMNGNGKKKGAE